MIKLLNKIISENNLKYIKTIGSNNLKTIYKNCLVYTDTENNYIIINTKWKYTNTFNILLSFEIKKPNKQQIKKINNTNNLSIYELHQDNKIGVFI